MKKRKKTYLNDSFSYENAKTEIREKDECLRCSLVCNSSSLGRSLDVMKRRFRTFFLLRKVNRAKPIRLMFSFTVFLRLKVAFSMVSLEDINTIFKK